MDREYSRNSKRRACRRIKRKFHGNQYVKKSNKGKNKKKDNDRDRNEDPIEDRGESGEEESFGEENFEYAVMQYAPVFKKISDKVICKICEGEIEFAKTSFNGLAFEISLECNACGTSRINSCRKIGEEYEINTKFVFVTKLLGVPWKGINLFLSLMDMTNNFSRSIYKNAKKSIKDATTSLFDIPNNPSNPLVKPEVLADSPSSDNDKQQQEASTSAGQISNTKSWWDLIADSKQGYYNPGNILNIMQLLRIKIGTTARNYTSQMQVLVEEIRHFSNGSGSGSGNNSNQPTKSFAPNIKMEDSESFSEDDLSVFFDS